MSVRILFFYHFSSPCQISAVLFFSFSHCLVRYVQDDDPDLKLLSVGCLSMAGATVAQLEFFFSSKYLRVMSCCFFIIIFPCVDALHKLGSFYAC